MFKRKLKFRLGFTLVEVLVGLAVLSVVGVAAFSALVGSTKARAQSDVRTTAVSLADTAMETIKGAATPYVFAPTNTNPTGADYTANLPSIPANYHLCTLNNTNAIVVDRVYGLPWHLSTGTGDPNVLVYGSANPADPGIQKVTIIVRYYSQEIFRLTDFKVNRNH
jgi:prepilin-type N-terminal cleavage/methylation domain-containing protein